MRSKTALLAFPILLLAAACRPKGSPDQAIRDTLSKAVKAVEGGDAPGAAAILDDRFQGPEGMSKAAAQLYLGQILRQGKVGVTITGDDLGVNGGDAFEKLHVIVTQQGGGLLPDGSRKIYILHWTQRGSDWRLLDIQDFTDAPSN